MINIVSCSFVFEIKLISSDLINVNQISLPENNFGEHFQIIGELNFSTDQLSCRLKKSIKSNLHHLKYQ